METEQYDAEVEEDLRIDEDALDVEWLRQPTLYAKWNRRHADAEAKVGQRKQKLDMVRAELARTIRTNPGRYKITDRITENVVEQTTILDEGYQTAMKRYLNAQKEVGYVLAIVRSLAHRKDALENLVRLMGQEYFSGPIAPRDLSKEMTTRRKTEVANRKIREASAERK